MLYNINIKSLIEINLIDSTNIDDLDNNSIISLTFLIELLIILSFTTTNKQNYYEKLSNIQFDKNINEIYLINNNDSKYNNINKNTFTYKSIFNILDCLIEKFFVNNKVLTDLIYSNELESNNDKSKRDSNNFNSKNISELNDNSYIVTRISQLEEENKLLVKKNEDLINSYTLLENTIEDLKIEILVLKEYNDNKLSTNKDNSNIYINNNDNDTINEYNLADELNLKLIESQRNVECKNNEIKKLNIKLNCELKNKQKEIDLINEKYQLLEDKLNVLNEMTKDNAFLKAKIQDLKSLKIKESLEFESKLKQKDLIINNIKNNYNNKSDSKRFICLNSSNILYKFDKSILVIVNNISFTIDNKLNCNNINKLTNSNNYNNNYNIKSRNASSKYLTNDKTNNLKVNTKVANKYFTFHNIDDLCITSPIQNRAIKLNELIPQSTSNSKNNCNISNSNIQYHINQNTKDKNNCNIVNSICNQKDLKTLKETIKALTKEIDILSSFIFNSNFNYIKNNYINNKIFNLNKTETETSIFNETFIDLNNNLLLKDCYYRKSVFNKVLNENNNKKLSFLEKEQLKYFIS